MIDYLQQQGKKYKKALFLDRDGTIIVDTVMPHRPEDLIFFEDTIPALREAGKLDAYIIMITNQSGIALGKYTRQEMTNFHRLLLEKLQKEGIRVDAILFCPHYDIKNYPPGYNGCSCSKPNPGLLFEARKHFGFILEESYLIGDKHTDIGAGINAGCRANILVTTGIYKSGGYEQEPLAEIYKPTYIAASLYEAVLQVKDMQDGYRSFQLE